MNTVSASLHENPFNPGYGLLPPYLAGRSAELFSIFRHVGNTVNGKLVARDVVIYGPRGSGKTALLRAIAEDLKPLEANVTLELMVANDLQSLEDVRRELTGMIGKPLSEAWKPGEWGFIWSGMRAKWQRGELSRGELRKGLVAKCRKRPLILMVDEAHRMPPAACNELLSEMLTIRGMGGPAIAILAGKPALVELGDLAQVSFLERGELVSVHLLDEQSAGDAVRIPLERNGIDISEGAIGQVVSHSQGYPQFLQLWGSALWDQASIQGKKSLDDDDSSKIAAMMERERKKVYQGRLASWTGKDRKLLGEIARKLLQDGWMARESLEEAIEKILIRQGRDIQDCQKIIERMVDSDFLWCPRGQERMIPALPSFVSFAAGQKESVPHN